ncbi:MAG: hypothetical protein M0Z38_04725 [Deltaproteobacteria bacterium]|nr:hypothetical protein [Deltaproteobacteria bacterium]
MTAKTNDGRQVFSGTKTYMPIAQRFGRGRRMGHGAYEKSGLIEDTSLPVGKPVTERYEIPVRPTDIGATGEGPGTVEVTAKLWYLPGGKRDSSAVLWREGAKKVSLAP